LVEDVRAVTKEVEFQLDAGDVLVLYSDGLTEAMNARDEQFGLDRVCAEIEAAKSVGPKEIRDRLLAAVAAWQPKQADDVTIMVIHQDAVVSNANAAVA